jgi:antitoxin VapB
MLKVHQANLFRNGHNQAVRIPRELELPCDRVRIHREGYRLVIEPIDPPKGLIAILEGLPALENDLPDVDSGLASLDDVVL